MQNKNILDSLPRKQVIDKTVFRITREFMHLRSPEAAFIQCIKDSRANSPEYRD